MGGSTQAQSAQSIAGHREGRAERKGEGVHYPRAHAGSPFL